MSAQPSPTIAISTWSIHRAIGVTYPNSPGNDVPAQREETWGPGTLSLMEVPSAIAALGIHRLEICSFHVPAHDRGFVDELRASLAEAGVALQTLLIDDGDITDPIHRQRDVGWIGRWIDVSAALGAERARAIAGKQKPTSDVLSLSVDGLRALARRGAEQGVRVMTENWFDTLRGPGEVHEVLDRLEGEVGFLADFGNWQGAGKYDDLASVLGRAEDAHAKAHFDGTKMDGDDFGRCLEAARAAGYTGPYTLIYESANDDEWTAVREERDFVRARVGGGAAAASLTRAV